jgi:site-specific recombinase XerD
MKKDLEASLLPNNERTLPAKLPVVKFFFLSGTEQEKRNEKNGKGTLFFSITYNKKRSVAKTTHLKGYKKDFDEDAQRFFAKGYDYENETLTSIESDILQIYKDLKRLDKVISADILKRIYTQQPDANTLKNVFALHLQHIEQKYKNGEITLGTFKIYKVHTKKMYAYLKLTKNEKLLITEVGTKFCNQYSDYLKTLTVDVERALGTLKRVLDYARLNEFVKENRFYVPNYTKKKKNELIYLAEQELYVLENYQFANEYLQKAADLFVFQCYTGFSYADLASFDTKLHTRVENNGTIWIYKQRQKNGEVARLPLFPKAFYLLEKYHNKLPILSNQNYNAYLKEIALLVKITKKLTTHVARKTAGFVWLNTGLDYETVAAMLGHSNIRITQSTYAKVLTNRIQKKLQEANLALFIGRNEYDKLLLNP